MKKLNAGKSSKARVNRQGRRESPNARLRIRKRLLIWLPPIASCMRSLCLTATATSARAMICAPIAFGFRGAWRRGSSLADDIMEFDLSGEAIDARGRATYAERFIHSEIYRHRPEVKAIVHSHSPAVIPFGVTSIPLKPIFHMSGFLGAGVPIFEIRETAATRTCWCEIQRWAKRSLVDWRTNLRY